MTALNWCRRGDLSCCARIKRAYVFCFKELTFFSQKHFALCSLALNPQKVVKILPIPQIKKVITEVITFFIMPKGGLEPPRIAPYAPETHVSTIPPLRQIVLFSFQNLYSLRGGVDFKSTLSVNDN